MTDLKPTIGRPRIHATPEDSRAAKIIQARDCKRRRRELRKALEDGARLCSYGYTKLCINPATDNGNCTYHNRLTKKRDRQ